MNRRNAWGLSFSPYGGEGRRTWPGTCRGCPGSCTPLGDLWLRYPQSSALVVSSGRTGAILPPGAISRGCFPAAQAAGLYISLATMIHRGNVDELAKLDKLVQQWGVREWHLDVPCVTGRLAENRQLYLEPAEAAPYLALGFGGSDHGSEGEFACGLHLAAVLLEGVVAKCGLFGDQPLGRVEEGLKTCWSRLNPLPLGELQCAPCPHLRECRGGCRFRGEALRRLTR